jgi:hypothetical protein
MTSQEAREQLEARQTELAGFQTDKDTVTADLQGIQNERNAAIRASRKNRVR